MHRIYYIVLYSSNPLQLVGDQVGLQLLPTNMVTYHRKHLRVGCAYVLDCSLVSFLYPMFDLQYRAYSNRCIT